MAKDVLLNIDNDLLIKNGDFVIGDSLLQETAIILQLSQGDLKSDPLLGPNLTKLIRSRHGANRAVSKVKLHLQRDKKNYNKLKQHIILGGK